MAGEGLHSFADLSRDTECPMNRYISVYDATKWGDAYYDHDVKEWSAEEIKGLTVVMCYECKNYMAKIKSCKVFASGEVCVNDYCSYGERE